MTARSLDLEVLRRLAGLARRVAFPLPRLAASVAAAGTVLAASCAPWIDGHAPVRDLILAAVLAPCAAAGAFGAMTADSEG